MDVKSRVDERSKGKGKKGKDARDWNASANSPGITSTSPSDKGSKGQRRRDRQENLDTSYLEHKTPDFGFWEPLLRNRGLLDEFLGNKTCSTAWSSNASPNAESSAGGGTGSGNGTATFGAAFSSSWCGSPRARPNAHQHRDDNSHAAFGAPTAGMIATDQESQSGWHSAPQPQWTSSASSSREQEQAPAPPPAVDVPQIQRQPAQSSSSQAPTLVEEFYIGTPAPAKPEFDAYAPAHCEENATNRGGQGARRASDGSAHLLSPHKSVPARMGPAPQPLDSSHMITSSGKSLDSVEAVAGGSPDLEVTHAATPDLSYDRTSSTSRKKSCATLYPPPADCMKVLLAGCAKDEYAAWQECNAHGEFMKEARGCRKDSEIPDESGKCTSTISTAAGGRGGVGHDNYEDQNETKSFRKKELQVYTAGEDEHITIEWNGTTSSGRVKRYTDNAGTKSERFALKLDGAWWYCRGYEKRLAEGSKRGQREYWFVIFNDSSGATRFFREPKPPKSTPSSTKKSKKEKKSKRAEA